MLGPQGPVHHSLQAEECMPATCALNIERTIVACSQGQGEVAGPGSHSLGSLDCSTKAWSFIFSNSLDLMDCGYESFYNANVDMSNLGLESGGRRAVGGTGSTADNPEYIVTLLMVHTHYKHGSIGKRGMLCTLQCSLLGRPRGLEALTRQRVSWKLNLLEPGILITHILIPYPHVSLVYGSTCSLLVLFYYKCLLRLNSDIAKPSPVFQCPRKSLSRPWAWNSGGMLPIQ